jgi:hypothetical protein
MSAAEELRGHLRSQGLDLGDAQTMAEGMFDRWPLGRRISAANATWAVNAVLGGAPLTRELADRLEAATGVPWGEP